MKNIFIFYCVSAILWSAAAVTVSNAHNTGRAAQLDVLGRPLRYNELDREYVWMSPDDHDIHSASRGTFTSYTPRHLGLNLETEIDEASDATECRVEHIKDKDAPLEKNQYIIEWKSDVSKECKLEVFHALESETDDYCTKNMKLGRSVALLNAFGVVASPNRFMNCIVRNDRKLSQECLGRSIKALCKECNLDVVIGTGDPIRTGVFKNGFDMLSAQLDEKVADEPDVYGTSNVPWGLDRIDDQTERDFLFADGQCRWCGPDLKVAGAASGSDLFDGALGPGTSPRRSLPTI